MASLRLTRGRRRALQDQAGRATPDGIELTLGRTQEELALEIGAARESVSRTFKQLRRRV